MRKPRTDVASILQRALTVFDGMNVTVMKHALAAHNSVFITGQWRRVLHELSLRVKEGRWVMRTHSEITWPKTVRWTKSGMSSAQLKGDYLSHTLSNRWNGLFCLISAAQNALFQWHFLPLLLGYASNVKWYAITSGGNCLNAQNGRSNSQGLSVNAWETTSVSAAHTNVAWITGGRDYGTWDNETCRSSDRGRDNKFWTHIRQLEWNVETPGRHKEDSAFLHLTLRLYLVIREERLHRSRMSIKS